MEILHSTGQNRSTWAPALEGMKAVYISYQPDLAVEGATGDIQFLVELAVKAGIQKLVLLSRPRRAGSGGLRTDRYERWHQLHDPALQLVLPEFQ